MPDSTDVQHVELLLEALFLEQGAKGVGAIARATLNWVSEWLRLDPAVHFGEEALAHLVAVQLAPKAAVAYETSNPRPRWRLIDDYLADQFLLDAQSRQKVARRIATVLDYASASRGPTLILAQDARDCAICHLPFDSEPLSVSTRDPYKPVWQAPVELCRPEVDHVVPISSIGTHSVTNLQIICRACNLAKGAGLTVDPEAEVRYAGRDVTDVPRMHLFRLLQWAIGANEGLCSCCGDKKAELTMRPVHVDAPVARTTLQLRCYPCLLERA